MSTLTAPSARSDVTADRRAATFVQVLGSEWTKLWSLRSTAWTLATLFVVTVGFSVLAAWGTATNLQEAQAAGPIDVTNVALGGVLFGQLAIAVLGVLVISGEYSTGGIKTSLIAVPRRIRFLLAKGVVFTAVALVTAVVTCLVSFFAGMTFFTAKHVGVGLGDPHVLRAVLGAALYLTVSGLLGYAIALILRHTAGAITTIVALLFVIPIVLNVIPADIVRTINKYFLGSAGQHIAEVLAAPNALGPWTGFLVFTAETAALLIIGAALLQRRDA
jgi:ABC-2 type transport system permease protein